MPVRKLAPGAEEHFRTEAEESSELRSLLLADAVLVVLLVDQDRASAGRLPLQAPQEGGMDDVGVVHGASQGNAGRGL